MPEGVRHRLGPVARPGAAKAVSGWTRDGMPVAGELLPMWAGGLVFLTYTAVAAVTAGLVSVRRDIT